MRQLYHSPTLKAPLPAIVSRNTQDIGRLRVLGAVARMGCALTDGASPTSTFHTRRHLILDEWRGDKRRATG